MQTTLFQIEITYALKQVKYDVRLFFIETDTGGG